MKIPLVRPAQHLIVLGTFFLFAGCQTFSSVSSGGRTATEFNFPLLSPDSLGVSLAISQKMSGEFDRQRFTFLVNAEVKPERIAMVANTLSGASLFQLVYAKGELSSKTFRPFPEKFPVQRILVDFQQTYWPLETIAAHLAQYNVQDNLHYSVKENPSGRVIRLNGSDIVEIQYSTLDKLRADIHFYNKIDHYRYQLETLSVERW